MHRCTESMYRGTGARTRANGIRCARHSVRPALPFAARPGQPAATVSREEHPRERRPALLSGRSPAVRAVRGAGCVRPLPCRRSRRAGRRRADVSPRARCVAPLRPVPAAGSCARSLPGWRLTSCRPLRTAYSAPAALARGVGRGRSRRAPVGSPAWPERGARGGGRTPGGVGQNFSRHRSSPSPSRQVLV